MFDFLKNLFKKLPASHDFDEEDDDDKAYQEQTLNGDRFPTSIHTNLLLNHKVVCLPEEEAIDARLTEIDNKVIIQIFDPGRTALVPVGDYLDNLTVSCWDIEGDLTHDNYHSHAYKGIVSASEQILPFIKKHLDKNIIIHCHLGVSRSAAVMAAVMQMRNDSAGIELMNEHPRLFMPNFYLYHNLFNEENT